MGQLSQLSQFVLLACIVTSCISYSIDFSKTMQVPEPPVEPSESDFSEFPTEFMKELIASLSPEEREELKQPIKVGNSSFGQRDGNTDEETCHKHQETQPYYEAKATDNNQLYYVVNFHLGNYQPVMYFACDEKKGKYTGKCKPANNHEKVTGHCCRQDEAKIFLFVIPKPIRHFVTRNGKLYHKVKGQVVQYKLEKPIQKEVYVKSDCVCAQHKPDIVVDEQYTCPNPKSSTLRWFPNYIL